MSKKITNKNRNLFKFGGQTIDPMKFSNQYIRPNTGLDMNSINASASKTLKGIGSTPIKGSDGLNISPYLGVAQGTFQLGSQFASNMDTSGIGNEVVSTNDMSRSDILNTQVDVNSNKSNTLGQAASGAMTGVQAGASFGPVGAAIGAGVGLISGGLSSILGNSDKQRKADEAENLWRSNLNAKNRQFQQQDLRQSMANFNALGGNMYAYGGNEQSPLVEFNSGGTHEQNINGGIMQGTGQNGKPNLVEEGETKHEDYIFSDRLKVNPMISKQFKLPKGLNGKTFADASKYLNREAKDRPNDPISKNAVKAHLAKLTAAQEGLKEQMQPQQQQGIPMEGQSNANMLAQGYANGGYIDQTHYQNPTLQGANIGAMGGNMFEEGDFMDMQDKKRSDVFTNIYDQAPYIQKLPIVLNAASPTGSAGAKYIQEQNLLGNKVAGQELYANTNLQPTIQTANDYGFNLKNALLKSKNAISGLSKNINTNDALRYAPVGANIAMGISDMFEKPEVVKYGRVNPERVTARMDYQPIDTEWMNNKMNATYAGTRDQMINQTGGNRAMAMAGLAGINQQQQNAMGQAYLGAQDINYNRRNQATQFNAGIEAQNVAAQNTAQQTNLQLQMQEMDANARNRAAKRNAARQAILNAASNIGDIGRENFNANTVKSSNGYGYDANGNIVHNTAEGTVFGDSIYKNGKWIKK